MNTRIRITLASVILVLVFWVIFNGWNYMSPTRQEAVSISENAPPPPPPPETLDAPADRSDSRLPDETSRRMDSDSAPMRAIALPPDAAVKRSGAGPVVRKDGNAPAAPDKAVASSEYTAKKVARLKSRQPESSGGGSTALSSTSPDRSEKNGKSPPVTTPTRAPASMASMASIPEGAADGRNVDQIMSKLNSANIVFNSPSSISLYDTPGIELVLSLAHSPDELKKRIGAAGALESARIKVSPRMEARLTGADFAITAVTPEEQAISETDVTRWKWEVKATSTGRHSLHLTLSALINVEGESTRRVIRTFDRQIIVKVTPEQRLLSFLKENWQWLWLVIGAPILGWLWRRRKRANANDGGSVD